MQGAGYYFVVKDNMADCGVDPSIRGMPGLLMGMVRWVAFLRGTTVGLRDTWAKAVLQKLHDIEIVNIRDFVEYSGSINCKLHAVNHKQLHFSTMELLLRAACDKIFEQGKRSGEAHVVALAEVLSDEDDVAVLMSDEELDGNNLPLTNPCGKKI